MVLLKDKKLIISLLFFFLFCLIAIVNHYSLRTFFDLGMINQALYQLGNLQNPLFTLGIDGKDMPFLATHFSPIIYLYYPFFLIFGHLTPTLIQILAISLAGVPIYKLSLLFLNNNKTLANYCLIHFYLIWGIYSALAFDFHNNVIGSMMVPWLTLFLFQKKNYLLIIASLLMVMCMETFGIWLFTVLLIFIIYQFKHNKHLNKIALLVAFAALVYSLLVINFVMPSLQNTAQNLQFGRYSHLGGSLAEVFLNLIKHPKIIVEGLFTNLKDKSFAIQKIIFLLFLFFSGCFLIYKNPLFIFIFLVPLALKFLSNDSGLFGIYHQYSIEFVPLLSMVLIFGLNKTNFLIRERLALACCALTAVCTFASLNFSLGEYDYKANSSFYKPVHFKPGLDLGSVKQSLKLIPIDAKVSASSCLSPYLFQRRYLYHFPIIKDAKYIAIIKNNRSTWPISEEAHQQKIDLLKKSGLFKVISDQKDMIIFKAKEN
ncbi:DUF2079 domain-containing protein [Pedobacter sp. SD-b]|uniref:DUF2079 domain-containing protein n=1 Tax=Pedobacter segetis TaxID=2793069 RepID=A0ABS1BJD0_9SPHI|nr:DUF2079 domain-containing protein [Pedobacter segetis]MBK0382928.1 DUF2079 domain-containing protein [Pedobacter segetis]